MYLAFYTVADIFKKCFVTGPNPVNQHGVYLDSICDQSKWTA